MTGPVLEVQNLTKRFDDVTAVRGISFVVQPGEIVGLVGPNGAGKTTTLQMLLGVTEPTAGQIHVFGRDLRKERETILSQVNFSSTYVSLPYSLTLRENLLVFAQLYGVPQRRTKVQETLELLDLVALADRKTKELSSGQQTRLNLAKSLLNEPRLLFLDEPTASLDPDSADRIRRLLLRLQEERGMAMLITSHNMKEMETLSNRLIFLDQGQILAEGKPQEILERYAVQDLEALFLMIARGENKPQ